MDGDLKRNVKLLDSNRVEVDGKVFCLAEKRTDGTFDVEGSHFVRVPHAFEFKLVSGGSRVQMSCPEIKDGNYLTYSGKLLDLLKGEIHYWRIMFEENTPDWRRKREGV